MNVVELSGNVKYKFRITNVQYTGLSTPDTTHYSLCLITSCLCYKNHENVTTDTQQPPQYENAESTENIISYTPKVHEIDQPWHPFPLLGIHPESQEPSTPVKVSITNVILFNLFTQTEFSHSKSLLKERVVKCLEKPGTALVGS